MKDHDQRLIHSSEESDWRTPEPCVTALHAETYEGISIDLAADSGNRKFPVWLGPGSPYGEDALAVDWVALLIKLELTPIGFLNPPFSRKLARAYRTGRIQIDGEWRPHEIDLLKSTWYEPGTWAEKCWQESQRGCTIYGVFPFAPQTEWYRSYVQGHTEDFRGWNGHAAMQERRIPHRISFLRPDGSPAENAGVNSAVIVWQPAFRIVGPWQPHSFYWSYR